MILLISYLPHNSTPILTIKRIHLIFEHHPLEHQIGQSNRLIQGGQQGVRLDLFDQEL
jgi:hypothetical protein